MAGWTPGADMDYLIWTGAAVTLVGFAGIIWSIIAVLRAKRMGLEDAALRVRLNQILPVNLGALFLSVIGLMMVVVGIILG
jgi:hypothetical protein